LLLLTHPLTPSLVKEGGLRNARRFLTQSHLKPAVIPLATVGEGPTCRGVALAKTEGEFGML